MIRFPGQSIYSVRLFFFNLVVNELTCMLECKQFFVFILIKDNRLQTQLYKHREGDSCKAVVWKTKLEYVASLVSSILARSLFLWSYVKLNRSSCDTINGIFTLKGMVRDFISLSSFSCFMTSNEVCEVWSSKLSATWQYE